MMSFWLASALGAVLFFAAGWQAGRSRRVVRVVRVPLRPPRPPPPSPGTQLLALREQLAGEQLRHARDRAALERVSHALRAARAPVERLRIDLMRSQKQRRDLESASATELGRS